MTLDDETLLSAFLDDELGEDLRLRVEEALLADSRLAQRLRDLAAVRDLVAGLERPAPARDLSAPVLDWVCDRRPARPLRQLLAAPRPRWLLIASGLTAAAAVLIASSLTFVNRPAIPVASPARTEPGPPLAASNAPAPHSAIAAGVAETPASTPVAEPSAGPVVALAAEDRRAGDDRQFLVDLLDRPDVRRIIIGVDELEVDGAAGQVGDILKKTGRKNPRFGRLSIGQGIVLDPDEPGRAIVFAFAADDPERTLLVSQIRTEFGTGAAIEVEDRPLDARVTTQLAGAGPVEVFESPRSGTLAKSPEDLTALKDRWDEDSSRIRVGRSPAPTAPAEAPTVTTSSAAPARSRAIGTAVGDAQDQPAEAETAVEVAALPAGTPDRPASREPATVLVWVTARDRARSGPR